MNSFITLTARDPEAQLLQSRALGSLALAGVLIAFIVTQCLSWNSLGGLSNWFVPDGITLAGTFVDFWSGELPLEALRGGEFLNIIYSPALVIGVPAFAIMNCLLLQLGARAFVPDLKLRELFLICPYFLLALALPSKDIVVLAFTMVQVGLLVRGHALIAIWIGVLLFFVRDGAAVISMAFLGVWLLARNHRALLIPMLCAYGLLTLGVAYYADSIFGEMFIYSRNLDIYNALADQTRLDTFAGLGSGLRVLANATNLALRPAFLDENGGIALIGVAYFVSGIAVLYAFLASCAMISPRRSALEAMAGTLFFVSLFTISVSPLIQPRYLLPAAVIVVYVHLRHRAGLTPIILISCAAIASVCGGALYSLSPLGLPLPADVAFWSPLGLF